MREREMKTAEKFGLLERCKAFEADLLKIPDIVPDKSDDGIPFDMNGFLSGVYQVIIVPKYDIRATRDDYWEARGGAEGRRGGAGRAIRPPPLRGPYRGLRRAFLLRVLLWPVVETRAKGGDGMTLANLLTVFGSGEQLHISTEHGSGWIFTGTPSAAKIEVPHLLDRSVVQMYSHEGREGSQYCRMLRPGTAIVVEGYECGSI